MALTALAVVIVVGTLGYLVLGFTLLEALYQTVTTVATVGFREVRPLGPAGEAFTIVLILLGVGTVLYNLGSSSRPSPRVTCASTSGGAGWSATSRGCATTSSSAGSAGSAAPRPASCWTAATRSSSSTPTPPGSRAAPARSSFGDAASDDTLRAAGIDRARDLVIISRARTLGSKEKLVLAGATRAVNPQLIGGRRMASFALHADVAEFLDEVRHDDDLDVRIEQVHLADTDAVVGRTLAEVDVSGTCGCQLLAVRAPRKGPFTPSPPPQTVLAAGATLIVFGTPDQVGRLGALAADGRVPTVVDG